MKTNRVLTFAGIIVAAVIVAIGCSTSRKTGAGTTTVSTVPPVQAEPDDSLYSGILFNENIRRTTALTPEEERLGFKLPEGFKIQLFASEPQIGKPINISFDGKGRMWVSQSFEYPFPAKAPNKPRDRVTILEDTDGDGRADKFTNFNDTLNIPIGILPLAEGAVSYSIPNVYRFTDNNNDGKADAGKKLLGPFGFTDTHGMVNNFLRGYDGWVYACHGFTNTSTISGADGHTITMHSGNTFRFKVNGSRVEQTTSGRINPFGQVYDEFGYLYSTDCHTSPLYQLIMGGDYYGWGLEEGMGFAPDMKPLQNEATALAGIAYYADVLYPAEYQKNFYIGDAVASRVYRNSYVNNGSSPVGKREPDFVRSRDPWFRPVDVKMGPDGAIYIADFYNSIIGHYEVPLDDPRRDKVRGRIWRVTYKGMSNKNTDLTTAKVEELLSAIDAKNMQVRMLAADQLADRIGQPAVAPLKKLLTDKSTVATRYIHAMWVLQRLNALTGEEIKKAAGMSDPIIRVHTMRILRERKADAAIEYPIIVKALKDNNPHVQRAALEVFVKYPDLASLRQILAFRKTIPEYDSHMIYTARLVERNILRNGNNMQQVAGMQWNDTDAANIADVLAGVLSEPSGTFLAKYMESHSVSAVKVPATYQHLARFAPGAQLDKIISTARQKSANDVEISYYTLKGVRLGIAQRDATENAEIGAWANTLADGLITRYPLNKFESFDALDRQVYALQLAGDFRNTAIEPKLKYYLTKESKTDPNMQAHIIKALLKINPEKNAAVAGGILTDPATPVNVKGNIAASLGDLTGTSDKTILASVNKALADVTNAPPDLQAAIVTSLATSPEGKDIIFEKVRKGEYMSRILLQPKVEERILMGMSPKQKKVYDEIIANVEPVNVERNKIIKERLQAFNADNAKKALPSLDSGKVVFSQNCATCHKISGEGGNIGPNLDGVSKWGPNNLAEKILDPNRNISEAFRNYTIKLKNGKVVSGLFRREEGAVFVFADIAGQEFTVAKKDIAERTAAKYTLMPDNFRDKLSQREFEAVINYLLNHKS
ncbi:c-type cytochrome [Mucilaginibacter limnophilus]|uniref:C-type cytochrome n=1 Tax=Mucilaginibacter limnophilus TaxID=1932778 RepID=A0A3S3THT2_9SPHI|nr:PVC-type heme-binding CxxCH protein [Mucilaginibacter limnophilus]RVU01351.1 c-type cytochrome [Mucilaginibacter limnophilus]